jgi:hypothetical protein
MVLQRNHHRDERRRRVLLEETGLDESETRDADREGATRSSGGCAKPYSDSALATSQPRVVDLIPVRVWSLVVLALLVACLGVGMEALYGYLALGDGIVALGQVPAFDLAAPGNIANWFAGVLLLLAAGLGCLTFLMRRHRTDDYRGRYRMWYWVVPLLMLASVNQTVDWGTSLRIVILAVVGIPDYPDATLIWAAIATLLATAVATRLVIEMRASRLAVVFVVAAWGSAGFVQAIQLGWILEGDTTFPVMAASGLRLLACGTLFLSLCFYSRHVHLEVHGQIVTKKRAKVASRTRARRKSAEGDTATVAPSESTKAESAKLASSKPVSTKAAEPAPAAASAASSAAAQRLAGMKVRVDAPHVASATSEAKPARTTPAPLSADAIKRRVSAPAVAEKAPTLAAAHPDRDSSGDGDGEDDDSSLSRSERRRLKKLQKRERRQG